jgi:hypothetical protein
VRCAVCKKRLGRRPALECDDCGSKSSLVLFSGQPSIADDQLWYMPLVPTLPRETAKYGSRYPSETAVSRRTWIIRFVASTLMMTIMNVMVMKTR